VLTRRDQVSLITAMEDERQCKVIALPLQAGILVSHESVVRASEATTILG
jgi:hypothetical protein